MKVNKRVALRNTNVAEGRERTHSQDASESGGTDVQKDKVKTDYDPD